MTMREAVTDPLAGMLGFQLRRASAALVAALARELEATGLTPGEATLLLLIGANSGVTQSAAARTLRAQPANLVPTINKLVAAAMLIRTPMRGRAVALSLSDAGRRLYADVAAAFARHEAQLGGDLSPEERQRVLTMLNALIDRACGGSAESDGGSHRKKARSPGPRPGHPAEGEPGRDDGRCVSAGSDYLEPNA